MAAVVFFLLSSCVMGLLVAVPSTIERKRRDAEDNCYRAFTVSTEDNVWIDSSTDCRGGPPGQAEYPNNADWTFEIEMNVPHEYLQIEYNVNIEEESQCSYDRLIFGYDTPGQTEIPVCGSQSGSFSVRLTMGETYKLRFVSDGSITSSGFWVNLNCDDRPYYSETDLPHYNRAPSSSEGTDTDLGEYPRFDLPHFNREPSSFSNDYSGTNDNYNYYNIDSYTTNRYNTDTYRPYDYYYTTNYYGYRSDYGGDLTGQPRESSEVRTAARLASLRTELRELTDAVREVVLTFDDFEAAYNNDNSPQYAEQPLSPEYMFKK